MASSSQPDHHRAPHAGSGRPAAVADRTGSPMLKGGAPRGMWWVAWRQHRVAVLTATTLMAALAAALVLFRMHLIATFGDLGCSTTSQAACRGISLSDLEGQWRLMHGVMIAAPVVLGVFVGVSIFAQDIGRGTYVVAVTQSVRRTRWWATKLTVAIAPLLAGLIGLGYLTQWMDHSNWMTHRGGMAEGTFQVQSIMPAAWGLLAAAIAATAGILLRSVVGSLLVAFVIAGGLIVLIAFPLRPHMVPTTREVTSVEDIQVMIPPGAPPASAVGPNNPGALFRDRGLLDVQGNALSDRNAAVCDIPLPTGRGNQGPDAASVTAYNDAIALCLRDQGIVAQYIDYIPAGVLWPMRLIETGVSVILAALFLGLGVWRLMLAAAKRRVHRFALLGQ